MTGDRGTSRPGTGRSGIERALAGQVVVVTGGGRGIGRAIALRLAVVGATVVLGGRDITALRKTGALIDDLRDESAGTGWQAIELDVTDEGSVAAFAAETRERAGTPDAVVCNSGIGGPSAPLWQLDRAGWEETFAVNVTGTFLTLRAFLPAMIARGSGSAVLIGSMTGKRPLAGRTPYAAGKLALVGLPAAGPGDRRAGGCNRCQRRGRAETDARRRPVRPVRHSG